MSKLFSNEFLSNIRTIQKARDNRKLVVFAGAGISKNSNVPLWWELTEELKKDIDSPNEKDDLKIAQLFYNQRGEKEYNERIRTILKYNQTSPNPLHKAILDLKPEHIITTNYDNLFEQAIQNEALAYSVVRKDQDLPYSLNTQLLIKMHGDFDELNIVLKEDDYLDYYKNFPLIGSFIQGIFASRLVLFIGFSFSDINLKYILQKVRNVLGKHSQPAYLITYESLDEGQTRYLKSKGINALPYSDLISEYLTKWKIFLGTNIPNDNIGNKIFNYLKFIDKFNFFEETQSENHIIDQVYNSLERFDELPYLPTKFYTTIFPFNTHTPKYHYQHNANWLKTENPLLSQLINELSIDKKIRLPIEEELSEMAQIHKVRDYNKKLNEIFHCLNTSRVFYLNNVYFYALDNTKKCNCLRCSYFSFDFKKVFTDIENVSNNLCNIADFHQELIRAYINCHLGRFKQAYLIYRDLANKSWSAGNYITYFLCKLNTSWIRYLIRHDNESSQEAEAFFQEIQENDLDRIVNNLPVSEDIRRIIISIKENEHFEDLKKEISENVQGLKEKYDIFKRGGWQTGGAQVGELKVSIQKLHSYFFLNSIYHERFKSHIELIGDAFEGLIVSIATNSRCEEKIYNLDLFYIQCVILHGDSNKIHETLSKYDIKNLILRENEGSKEVQEKFILLALNFFNSLYDKGLWEYRESSYISEFVKNNFFLLQNIRKIFHNFTQFLGVIEIDTELGKTIIEPFLIFLETESFLGAPNIKYSSRFFEKWLPLFTENQLKRLLKVTLRIPYQNHDDLLEKICRLIKKYHSFKIEDDIFLNEIIQTTTINRQHWNMLSYSFIVCDKLKPLMAIQVENILSKKFDGDFYINSASTTKIISYEKFFDKYLESLSSIQVILEKNPKFNPFGYDGDEIYFDWHIDQFFKFIFRENIILSDEQVKIFAKKAPFYDWLLNFDNFEYSHFNSRWFKHELSQMYLKRMIHNSQIKELLKEYLHHTNYEYKWLLEIYVKDFS